MTTTIHYVDAFCGAGKTYALVGYADRMANRGRKVMFVQPTTALVGETINKTLPKVGFTAHQRVITSVQYPWKVIDTLSSYLRNPDAGGEVLFVTHSAFFSLPYFDNPHDWITIIDEIPAVERQFVHKIPDAHEILTNHIEITDKSDDAYWRVGPKGNGAGLKRIARNVNDDEVFSQFSGFAATAISPHWDTYVQCENYASLIAERDVPNVKRTLVGSALMRPSVFAPFQKTIVAGACFTESIMHLLWSKRSDVEFKNMLAGDNPPFRLQYAKHKNGGLLDIHYALDGIWSKKMRDKVVQAKDGELKKVGDIITDEARSLFGKGEFVALVNNDKGEDIASWENCERLPNVSHGMNTFTGVHHAVLMSAINPHSHHYKFLKTFAGVEPDDVKTALYRQTVYQAAARTSIRDQQNKDRKTWIVPDKGTAEWLAGVFPGAKLHTMAIFHESENMTPKTGGRTRVYASDADRVAACRERKARKDRITLERMLRLDVVNGRDVYSQKAQLQGVAVLEGMLEPQNIAIAAVADPMAFQGTFLGGKMEKKGLPLMATFDDLVAIYRDWAAMPYDEKDDVPLWSPALYADRSDLDTGKGRDNVAFARHMILDNDGGDLTPDDFMALFPKWNMVIHSSWSHGVEKSKWRVLIETDALLDIAGYEAIANHIMKRLNDRGFWSDKDLVEKTYLAKSNPKVHGFDTGKLHPACGLFLPSQGAIPEKAFFIEARGGDRAPMDVYETMAQAYIPDEPKPKPAAKAIVKPTYTPLPATLNPKMLAIAEALRSSRTNKFKERKDIKVAQAFDRWDMDGDRKGQRDTGFWLLAVHLKNAGCDEYEIADHLETAAMRSNSKEKGKLKASIRRIVKKLGVE